MALSTLAKGAVSHRITHADLGNNDFSMAGPQSPVAALMAQPTLQYLRLDYSEAAADSLTKALQPAHHWSLVRFMLGKQVPSWLWQKRNAET